MSTAIKKADVCDFPRLVEEPEQLTKTQLFFNRELSLLEFHARVLEEALDDTNPLLERLKFLSIFSSNLDEFFMIRVSGLKEEAELGVTTLSADGLTPEQQLERLRERILPLVTLQANCLREEILPKLKIAGLDLATYDSLTRYEKQSLEEYFLSKIFPILTPLAVDPSHPFPYLSPLSLNIGLVVEAPDGKALALGNKHVEPRFVRIKVPQTVPRLLPVGLSGAKFVLLEDVIEANIHRLFPEMKPGRCHRFRVTRDADIELREQEAADLLSTIEEELRQRRFGTPVRLEVSNDMPSEMIEYLSESLGLHESDVYKTNGPLAVQEFMSLYDQDRPDLKDVPLAPVIPGWCSDPKTIFSAIKERDRLVHHPYDSYDCVTEFINQAVEDEDVVAIKICLYRTGPDSPIPPALIRASEQGKQVTALIELKARFDEEHNIEWARKLEEAGVHVVYGVLGLKTHSKLTLVVRREDRDLRLYVHIASGNYNPTTSCTYTDLGLFTADDDIGRDTAELFNYLTGFSEPLTYRKFFVAPVSLREKLNEMFNREIEHQRAGRPARIIAKFNRLADQQIIEKLYEVSRAGIHVDLIVRGICMLRPGVPGMSDNIKVRSIVGRFLEHSRVFYFANGGEEELYIGSADWMTRNLKHRIEVVAPINDRGSKRYLKEIVLDAYLRDNMKARELRPNGSYRPIPRNSDEQFDSQTYFIGRSSGKI